MRGAWCAIISTVFFCFFLQIGTSLNRKIDQKRKEKNCHSLAAIRFYIIVSLISSLFQRLIRISFYLVSLFYNYVTKLIITAMIIKNCLHGLLQLLSIYYLLYYWGFPFGFIGQIGRKMSNRIYSWENDYKIESIYAFSRQYYRDIIN